jgi:signal transduction histidine kinase
MLARLDRAAQHERDFIADASHELRTPLAILKTEIEVALRSQRTNAELRGALQVAGEETDRLGRLAEDLLVLERADSDALDLQREDVHVIELLEHVAARSASPDDITIDAADDLVINGDRDTLERAIGNLVDNAHRHGRAPITLLARREANAVEIHVLDAGPGFRDGFAERAFDRFARGDPQRTTAGAGLGLSIVRSIARAHDGDAFAGNRADQPGADIWVVLPAVARSRSVHGDAPHSVSR